MKIEVEPVGYVQAPRPRAQDDFWGGEQARIELTPEFAAEALQGLGEFSHIEVLFCFHQVDPAKIVVGAPVLDIKPVMAEFLPRAAVRQPQWSHELMRDYWLIK